MKSFKPLRTWTLFDLWFWWQCACVFAADAWRTRSLFRWIPVPDPEAERARTVDGGPQMYRFRFFELPAIKRIGFRGRRFAIHKILRPDNLIYGLHDHPWDFWSIVLWGSYTERFEVPAPGFPDRYRIRSPLTAMSHRAQYQHAIVSVDGPCYTLIITTGRVRAWGFPGAGIVVG